jgi:PBSX family phage terminase large subunit
MNIELTPKQTLFFDALFDEKSKLQPNTLREFYFFGGFGSGKSYITMLCIFILCVQYPNAHFCFIRATYGELADSVIPQFLSHFQESGQFVYKKGERIAEFQNGTRLDFRAFDRDTKILSNEYDAIFFSQLEELDHELFLQCLGRNRRKVGGLGKNIIIAEGNPASGWVKTRLKDTDLASEMLLIEARTRDNPFLPPEYETTLRQNYPEFWIRRYVDGEWENYDEMVFSEWKEEFIVPFQPSAYMQNFKQRIGMDYGWVNPTALVWGAVDYDDRIIIFDEWGGTQKVADEISAASKKHGQLLTICDYSIKAPDRDGRSLWDDLKQKGMWLQESNKQELENITLLNSLMKQGRLLVMRNCTELIKEIKNYRWKKLKIGEQKNHPETPIQKDNHYIDALLYLIASIEQLKSVSPEERMYKRSLMYNIQKKSVARNIEGLG